MTSDMCEVRWIDRFMRDMRGNIVRAVLRTLAGDVPQSAYRFDFGKLADEDEAEIRALCGAVFDSVFLDTEFIPGDVEWNERLAAEKNVLKALKQGVLSEYVRAAVKAALAFRSLATRDDAARAGGDDRPRLSALARQLIVLHAKFAPSMLRNVMQEVRDILPPDPAEPLPPPEPPSPPEPPPAELPSLEAVHANHAGEWLGNRSEGESG